MAPSPRKIVAIIGATGHIAKSLTEGFLREDRRKLLLFSRDPQRVETFLNSIGFPGAASCLRLDHFPGCECDVVLNCVGIGDPGALRNAGSSVFRLTESFDNLAIDYLSLHPDTRYIHFSSGAAYGGDFREPAGDETPSSFPVNAIGPADWYGIAKLHAEAKHRGLSHLPIIDLRIFGFFSRHIALSSRFLMSEAISAILAKKPLVTSPEDIVRDYIHPSDLLALVEACIDAAPFNDVFDAQSLAPARKSDILRLLAESHGLLTSVSDDTGPVNATGTKPNYYSTSVKAAAFLRCPPRFTSLDCIAGESDAILHNACTPSTNGEHT